MRTIYCAHLIEAADAPECAARQIEIHDGKVYSRRWRSDYRAEPHLCSSCRRSSTRTITADRCDRAPSAPVTSRWKLGCIIWRCFRRSIHMSLQSSRFRRSALGGAGTVMIHYTRVQGRTDLPTEAARLHARRGRCRRACRLCSLDAQIATRSFTARRNRFLPNASETSAIGNRAKPRCESLCRQPNILHSSRP